MLKVYTDGSCKGNGTKNAVGGWAYVIVDDEGKIYAEESGAEINTTNNRMEMMAVINGIKKLKELNSLINGIYTDSAYIHNCITQKWYINWQKNGWVNSSKQSVKNKDLWEVMIPYFEEYNFYKVKGHADNEWNNYVDKLAQSAAEGLK